MFEVKKLDVDNMEEALLEFFKKCKEQNIINNTSENTMKLRRVKDVAWWGAFDGKSLVSISGCYPCDFLGENVWRVLFRSATLDAYRGQGGSFSRTLNHDFCFGRMLPLQIDYAKSQGGVDFCFSTNNGEKGGVQSSTRVDRFVRRVLLAEGKVELLHENIEYNYCRQNIWKVI